MLTNLLLPSGYVGPGSFLYPVSAFPGGATLYVNSATGADNRGRVTFQGTAATTTQSASAQGPYTDPSKPLASVFGPAGALQYCKAGRGDLIVVAPGHLEALPVGAITVPGGVSILGIGYGNSRPQFTYPDTTTTITPSGTGVQFQNLIFDATTTVDAVVAMFTLATNGVQFVGCRLAMASATNQAVCGIILSTGADDFLFVNSEIDARAAAGAAFAIKNIAGQIVLRLTILSSYLHGDFSTAVLSILGTGCRDHVVELSTFVQVNAVKTVWAINTGSNYTACFTSNDLHSDLAALHTDFISGASGGRCVFFQNFGACTSNPPKSAILIPDVGTIP